MSEPVSTPPAEDRGAVGVSAITEGLAIAWDAIQANKVRSLLTVLGVSVGVGVVVTIGAIMTGLRSEVMDAFSAAGPNNFVVSRIDFTSISISSPSNRLNAFGSQEWLMWRSGGPTR